MSEGYGLRACAHHLVGVAAPIARLHGSVAPRAFGKRRVLPRASRRSLAGVDAPRRGRAHSNNHGNRWPDLYTPDKAEFSTDYAWIQNFNNGNQNYNDKNNRIRCRAVRK